MSGNSRQVLAPPDYLKAEARKKGVAWADRLTTKTQLAPGGCAGYPAGLGGRVRREREAELGGFALEVGQFAVCLFLLVGGGAEVVISDFVLEHKDDWFVKNEAARLTNLKSRAGKE